ncbi:myosin head, partial [Oesophagostomum dentatum]
MVEIDCMLDPGWKFLRLPADQQLQGSDIFFFLQEQAARRFDNKTHTWVPDPVEGFVVAAIAVEEGNNYTLTMPDGTSKKLGKDECQEINPAKFEKAEDMSSLTFLNEASVLHNLRQRYHSMLIYTYSGLFCVFINPYKMLPIYTDSVQAMYVNKRRSEMPPHLFAVSDEAYRNMMTDHENQSMLITGESGAGKTENTKKVIAYFANIGANKETPSTQRSVRFKDLGEASLENQVVQANPAIEAFGNGATVRNYNSSRYGKFIRIHFDKRGKLVGGDIEHYLLEKSRVIKQAPGERSYHIFYQIFTQKKLRDLLQLGDDIRQFKFVSQAEITVPGMDDKEEFRITDNAFDVMHFTDREKHDLYKTCAAIMHMSRFAFRQKPREEQAEIDSMDSPMKAAKLFGIDPDQLVIALVKPRIKVGTEWVNKGQTKQQVDWAVGALAKAIYARMFSWIIKRVNQTLSANLEGSANYIGVLDIAGFEIFDSNSFEQLWINFVNEKLQQFFNHHMFVLEQEEYEREGIQWEFIDFGLDLQACID